MSVPPRTFSEAVQQHQAGNFQAAEQFYRHLLRSDPRHVNALHLLGLLCDQTGRGDQALNYFAEALRLSPDFAAAHHNLGVALARQGRLDQAVASLRKAVRFNPNFPDSYNCLGNALREQGKFAEAVAALKKCLSMAPNFAEAHSNLGVAYGQQGMLDDAARSYREAVRCKPTFAEAHTNLGLVLCEQGKPEEAARCFAEAVRLRPNYAEAHNNLGNIRKDQDRLDEALACYRAALHYLPNFAEAHNNLGNVLKEQGQLDEALACYQEALRHRPSYAEAHLNIGLVLKEQGQFAGALASFQEALRHKPGYAEAHCNIGAVRRDQGRFAEALAAYDESLRLDPDFVLGHINRGGHWLLLGDFERGWPEYEWHRRDKKYSPDRRQFAQPLWDGSDLAGKTILLHAEQGIGDVVQFIRYAAVLQNRGATVIFECPGHLTRLMGRVPGIAQLVTQGSPLPAFDVRLPLTSLAGVVGTTLSTIPAEVPYLIAEPDLVERWGLELDQAVQAGPGAKSSLRVGIAWQGNPKYLGDRFRSIPLACFAPLARVDGVHFFSLQKGPGSEQILPMAGRLPVIDLGPRLDQGGAAFVDTAAVMKNLDLIITSDTATAHVAGALGVPVWVALSYVPEWRWLLDRADSPWYPTMRLFRQTAWGDWPGVFERMTAELTLAK